MVPELRMVGAKIMTLPPVDALNWEPASRRTSVASYWTRVPFHRNAGCALAPVGRESSPRLKASSCMRSAETVSDPASTRAPSRKTTPLGLTM